MCERHHLLFAAALLLLFLLAHTESHHAPCEIFHALLVGKLLLCFCEELPDLSGEGIIGLELVDIVAGAARGIEGGEESAAE